MFLSDDLGVVFDGDGDRAVFVDDKGRDVPSYVILYLLSLFSEPPFVGDIMVYQSMKMVLMRFAVDERARRGRIERPA